MDIRKHLFLEIGGVLEQTALGGSAVTIPAGFRKGRCSSEGHGLVSNIAGSWTGGLDNLRHLFQL